MLCRGLARMSMVGARSFGARSLHQSASASSLADTVNSPNHGGYRLPATPGEENSSTKAYQYFVVAGAGAGYAGFVKHEVHQFINYLNPSADVQALASLEFDVADIPEGNAVTVKWRGKPIFVRHRTEAEISSAVADDNVDLPDPELDSERCQNPKYLVLIGICTHLGCVPLNGSGKWGGWFCPCHGSHYDVSGRIRAGPAPANLEVPPYKFVSDTAIVIGD